MDHIRECHKQRTAVTRVTVIYKALVLDPNFLGGLLSDNFVLRSMGYTCTALFKFHVTYQYGIGFRWFYNFKMRP